jgi:hypothetical protein
MCAKGANKKYRNCTKEPQHDRTDTWIAWRSGKEVYQTNRRRMCWAALGMMIACTAATIYDPVRMYEADSILMAQYLALSGLVGAYFALGKR